ncbi:unnamed protein product [Caenorhabditis auriculariae]|uniref:guanylate cyclase n=1 Tax=Caenorhabditis auriculariae TaxID=2777116 RepID=A0A8S1HXM9_9PELO|nr:unnamed protein product [Caenorhabditis auriculariae]
MKGLLRVKNSSPIISSHLAPSECDRSGFENGKENIVNHYYSDQDTYILVDSVSVVIKVTRDQVWELYGAFLITYSMEIGWDELVRALSPNLKGFLDNLDALHYFIDHVVFKANLRGPSFRCEENADGTLMLHYFTGRPGLYPIVKGVVKEVAKCVFDMDISLTVQGRTQRSVHMSSGERVEEHVMFLIKDVGEQRRASDGSSASLLPTVSPVASEGADDFLRLSELDFAKALPYHFVMDDNCKLVQCGRELHTYHAGLLKEFSSYGDFCVWKVGFSVTLAVGIESHPDCFHGMCPSHHLKHITASKNEALSSNHIPAELLQPGTPVLRIFEVTRPQIPLDFDNVCNFINAVFVMQVKTSPLKKKQLGGGGSDDDDYDESKTSNSDYQQGCHLKLKGQMMVLGTKKHLIYLCSPYVTSINELMQFGMRLTAMPLHDATRDLILLNQQRLTDVEVNLQLEANNEQLESMTKDLEAEKEKTDAILKDMLPVQIAERLLRGEHIEPTEYETSIMFCDVPAFQQIIPMCPPKNIVQLLNVLFGKLDRLVVLRHIYKVETVGDSYMTVSGIPDHSEDHAEVMCHVALGMMFEARSVYEPVNKKPLMLRVGIHSGTIVAGVVGSKMPSSLSDPCLDTPSLASRSASPRRWRRAGIAGKIHCSDVTYKKASETGRFEFQGRGRLNIKGQGEMDTYFLIRSLKKSIWEIVERERDVNLNSIEGYEELESSADAVQTEPPEQAATAQNRIIKNSAACVVC